MTECVLSDDECVVIFIYRNFFVHRSINVEQNSCGSRRIVDFIITGKWKVKMMRINK